MSLIWHFKVVLLGNGDIRRWLGHEGRAQMNGIHAFVKETPESSFSPLAMWSFCTTTKLSSFNRGHMTGKGKILSICVHAMPSHFSCVQLYATLWTTARQAPLSLEFSRQECWSGLPCSPPGDLPHPEIEPASLQSLLQWHAGSLPLMPPGKPTCYLALYKKVCWPLFQRPRVRLHRANRMKLKPGPFICTKWRRWNVDSPQMGHLRWLYSL